MHVVAILFAVVLALAGPAAAQSGGEVAAFRSWVETEIWPEASRRGVSRETFERAFAGLELDRSLPDLAPPGSAGGGPRVQWQAEFASPGRYFAADNLAALERIGRGLIGEWGQTLATIEQRYGVPKEIVVAIWGRESGFGRVAMPKPAMPTLATMAFTGYRKDMYRGELLAALVILEQGHVSLSQMRSSIAGALGQPQFLPSKYLDYAVDFDGDGRADIWNSVPDTLASIANYLSRHGWNPSAHWGFEAAVPTGVHCALEGPEQGHPLSEWQGAGVTRIDGSPLPGSGRETRYLMMPAGRLGPAFIVSENFYVLKTYNESDLYALFIGHLADRMRGGGPIAGDWRTVSGFRRGDVRQMQETLVSLGHDVGGTDGLVGFRTRIALGTWQSRNGMAPTCYPDAALIERIAG